MPNITLRNAMASKGALANKQIVALSEGEDISKKLAMIDTISGIPCIDGVDMDDAQVAGFTMALENYGLKGGKHGQYKDASGNMITTENYVWSRFGGRVNVTVSGVTVKI